MPNRPKSAERWLVDPSSGCWIWQRATNGSGYGMVRVKGKTVSAHRYVYELYCGKIPPGLHLDHVKERCQNTMCVNPAHMEPVTPQENSRRGKRTRLSDDAVAAIKSSSESSRTLARRYGVSVTHINHIKAGRRCCRG